MSYEHLQNTLKAIALTVPAARAFQMTVEFALPKVRIGLRSAGLRAIFATGRR